MTLNRLSGFWSRLNLRSAIALGLSCGLFTSLLPGLVFEPNAAAIGGALYWPFHGWFVILMFLVIFSKSERDKRLKPGLSAHGGMISLFFETKYGLFCISWFSTIMFTVWLLKLG